MKKTIWKYALQIGTNKISMPFGAQILTAQIQNGELCIWCIVNGIAEEKDENRHIEVFGTGHPLPAKADVSDWIATVQYGNFVFHVFEFAK